MSFITSEILSEGGITGNTFFGDGSNLTNVPSQFNGGTVTGGTNFTGGLSANTISATTITGTTLYGDGSNLTNVPSQFNGGTVTGATNFTGGLTANTISATTITGTTLYGDGSNLVGVVPTGRTISTTSPLSGGGDLSADKTISITQSNTSTDGYLSSTDWNTFNDKTKNRYTNSTGTQSIPANTITYITNSNISTDVLKAGTVVTWDVSVTKTNAGTAAPSWQVKYGTNSSTADATLITFAGNAQTAAVDDGVFTIKCVLRTAGGGTSAVLAGHYSMVHRLDATGLSNGGGSSYQVSAGFNSTTANAFFGLTVNSGASAVWTINQVFVRIENLD